MNPRIELKGPMHFVGISDTFISVHSPDANNFKIIPALWSRFCDAVDSVTDPVDRLSYGVIYGEDEPSRPDELRYLAACRVSSAALSAPGLEEYSSPQSLFAIFEHKGPIASIGQTHRDFGQWLNKSEFTRSTGAEIEVYPEAYDPRGLQSVMETWIPVAKR